MGNLSGVLTYTRDAALMSLMVFVVDDDKIVRILALADPERLSKMPLPA